METIYLKAMTRELCHALYRRWTNDTSIYMDIRLFKPYVYDEAAVNRYFDTKGRDPAQTVCDHAWRSGDWRIAAEADQP